MQTQIQDFQTPVVMPEQALDAQNEWSPRYGILVGGFPQLNWDGVGEMSVGHSRINRRVWMPFVRLRVGRRPDYPGALEMSELAVQVNWADQPDRLTWKSPRDCAQDVIGAYKEYGYCVPEVLIGHSDPQGLCDEVWPREVRDSMRLWQHIDYLQGLEVGGDAATLKDELLGAMYQCRGWAQEYIRTLRQEMEKEKGLKTLNGPLMELFYETNEPLPEKRAAMVAQEVGKEIVKAQGDGRKDDAIIGALNAITNRLERLEAKPVTEPNSSTVEEAEASNTQTGITKTGQPDRRYKTNKEIS